MDDIERRIIHLEHSQAHDRQLIQLHLSSFHQRLTVLERRPPLASSTSDGSGSIKLWLAFLLPLLVLLMTGDLQAALKAMRLAAGG